MFILDTNVISEQRRIGSARENPNVAAWTNSVAREMTYISVVTVRELETWVLLRARRDPDQGKLMRRWFEESVLPAFQTRIIDIDQVIARCCAGLYVPNPRPLGDSLIAATALVHGLTVVTRNTSDFAPMGVKLLNPWEPQG